MRQIYLGRRGDFQIYKLTKNCKNLQKLFCKKADDFELKLNEDLKNEFGQVMDTYGDLYSELMLERLKWGCAWRLRRSTTPKRISTNKIPPLSELRAAGMHKKSYKLSK